MGAKKTQSEFSTLTFAECSRKYREFLDLDAGSPAVAVDGIRFKVLDLIGRLMEHHDQRSRHYPLEAEMIRGMVGKLQDKYWS